jgi:hypothetical protein
LFIGLSFYFVPESAESIKTITGVDLSEPMAFLTSGFALAGAANMATPVKQKIGRKGDQTTK